MFSNPTKIKPKSWIISRLGLKLRLILSPESRPKTNRQATHLTCVADVRGKRRMEEATHRREENDAYA